MGKIETVLGEIQPAQLGWCQCHEHIFLEKCKSYDVNTALMMNDLTKSTQELVEYQKAGGKAIVDAQPVAGGRMVEWQIQASKESGVHIIASTGFHKTMFYYEDSILFTQSEEQLTDLFIEECQEGMYSSMADGFHKTQAKAGAIKVAADSGGVYADKTYEKLFAAAAHAQKATGRTLVCHIENGADALEVIDFFTKQGIAPQKIIICHIDRTKYDFDYHKEVAQTGVFLDYDTINRLNYHDNDQEARLICHMLENGYEKQLLFALDTTNKRLRNYGADMGLDFILTEFKPFLIEKYGIPAQVVEHIMTINAQNALIIR